MKLKMTNFETDKEISITVLKEWANHIFNKNYSSSFYRQNVNVTILNFQEIKKVESL